ncbi:MAG: 50S ribosomal protein L21 [Spirochaetia bacterium]|jgi:large subunit ribosomal protein L21|nr:50S ribosomal protein L21 [Spirochaetia bacterium]MCF7940796.1 50S ribosomal protein L21 [Spirochaetia bacterium]
MYALVEIQGKQYKAQEGAVLTVDKINKETGETVEFDSVLMVSDGDSTQVGQPYVAGAKVTAVLEDQVKGKKVVIFKFKRRKGYKRKQGHRQKYTQLLIKEIKA